MTHDETIQRLRRALEHEGRQCYVIDRAVMDGVLTHITPSPRLAEGDFDRGWDASSSAIRHILCRLLNSEATTLEPTGGDA